MLRRALLGGLLLLTLLLPGLANAQDEVRVRIPALEVDSALTEFRLARSTWRISPWATGVGHLEGTGWFGTPGNTVLAAHSVLPRRRPGLFAHLDNLTEGDEIFIDLDGESRRYVVTSVSIVSMYDTAVVAPTADERLTLITCDAASYDPQHQLYQQRIVVTAAPA